MKFSAYKSIILIALLGVLTSCSNGFDDINENPTTVAEVQPREFFGAAIFKSFDNSFLYYYDNYRRVMPWTQLHVARGGNSANTFTDVGNMGNKYSVFFGQAGPRLAEVQHMISDMSEGDQAAYSHLYAYATILKVFNGWQASDSYGAIAYDEAFQARYGGVLKPEYNYQEELFDIWDAELKDAVARLSNTTTEQVAVSDWDFIYNGDSSKWLKAANALRIKLAMRLEKRNPSKMASIVNEVVAAGDLFESIDDEFKFVAGNQFTEHGNFEYLNFVPAKGVMDFMNATEDPRRALLIEPNDYSSENITLAVAEGKLPAGTAEGPRFVGVPASPDAYNDAEELSTTANITLANGTVIDTVSYFYTQIWYPEFQGGEGRSTFPLVTFADYCFMRAELAVDGIGGNDAETWYNMGIEASIKFYSALTSEARVPNNAEVTDDDIAAFLEKDGVKFDASIAKQQIRAQAYLHYYKQPNEAWALIKRTGMPNTTTPLSLEEFVVEGSSQAMPRREQIPTPSANDLNYANQKAALDYMKTNVEGFGTSESDVFGRVWWDKPE